MIANSPPSLFGRLTLVHTQHESLARLLGRLDETAHRVLQNDAPREDDGGELAKLLSEWRRQLEAHFTAEEGPAHFETIAADRPSLLPAIVDLRADHAAMRDELAHLETLASKPGERDLVATGVAGLATRFRAHERAEAAMLAEYLGEPELSS